MDLMKNVVLAPVGSLVPSHDNFGLQLAESLAICQQIRAGKSYQTHNMRTLILFGFFMTANGIIFVSDLLVNVKCQTFSHLRNCIHNLTTEEVTPMADGCP